MVPPPDKPGAEHPARAGQVREDESAFARPDEAAPPLPSHIGPYAVTGVLGHGGMGIVYAAEDPKLRRRTAIKILAPAMVLHPAELTRFEEEARLLAALNHPNIATIFSLEQQGDLHFITMELVSGSTLAERVAQGPMTPAEAVDIGGQIAEALEAAHDAGIIHLDLKPTNIMLTPEARVKLLDFGFARASPMSAHRAEGGENDPTLDLTIRGTPGYMSPEQLRREHIDHRSDVWAFGCLLFEVLAGSPAFPGRTGLDRVAATLDRPPEWGALPEGTPERLRRLIAHCLDKDADCRLGSMSQARRIMADEAVSARGVLPIVPQAPGLDEQPTNLPLQLTTFIGREGPLAELSQRLERTRLVTVAGPGGCGKSRLCIEVGRALVPRFAGGVWLVELAPIAESGLVPQAVAQALGVREDSGRSLEETLRRHLKTREVLLLLDNCEHLIEASARLAEGLLQSCPKLRVLASSRERLGIAGETVFQLPPLATPQTAEIRPLEELERIESVRLFVERAQAVDAGFTLNDGNAAALIQICRRLDGIPLAIELAAARIEALRPEEIARRLDDRFVLLRTGSRTALPRHQTLRALIDWSFDQLSEKERILFRRLAVFAGRWPLEAAEEVCSGDGIERGDVLDLLSRLVEKSLIERDTLGEQRCGQVRYRALETMREYAREQLRGAGEEDPIRRRHRDWVVALAVGSSAHLVGPEQGEWLQRLEVDHDNIRAAIADACRRGTEQDNEAALRIASALGRYWYNRGRWTEGRELMRELLALPGAQQRDASRAQALAWTGWIALWQGDLDEASALNQESLSIRRELGDRMGIAQSLNNLGAVALERGEYEASRTFHLEGLALRRAEGNLRYQAVSLHNIGEVYFRMGEYEQARSYNEESLALRRKVGDLMGIADSLNALGMVAERLGDLALARSYHEQSLASRREREDPMGIAESLHYLAEIDEREGQFDRAMLSFSHSLAIRSQLADRLGTAFSLESIGCLQADSGAHREAACILAAAATLRIEIESPAPPAGKARLDATTAKIREALGEDAFRSEWERGSSLSLDEAIALASSGVASSSC